MFICLHCSGTSIAAAATASVPGNSGSGGDSSHSEVVEEGQSSSSRSESSQPTASSSSHSSRSSESTTGDSGQRSSLWESVDVLSMRSRERSRPVMSAAALTQEMELYNSEPPVPRNACPLKWWKVNAIRFKTLAVMARVFLCVPATQTKSERLNSTSGHIVEDRRSKLLTQHVTELTFLHENL